MSLSSALGGWSNTKAAIRTGDLKEHRKAEIEVHAEFGEVNQLSASEYRAFWIEYNQGFLQVGNCAKGAGKEGTEAPFMQWNAGAYYNGLAPLKVNLAVSTWRYNTGDWVFYQLCN